MTGIKSLTSKEVISIDKWGQKEFKPEEGWRHYIYKGGEYWIKNFRKGKKTLGQVRVSRSIKLKGPYEVEISGMSAPGTQNPHTSWEVKSLGKAQKEGEDFLKESSNIKTEELVSYFSSGSRLPKIDK